MRAYALPLVGALIVLPGVGARTRAPVGALASDTLVVTVPGARLHYVDRGSGTPVVLVHGSLGQLGDWSATIDAFAPSHRVIAYSRRFHPPNRPATAADRYVLDQHAEDLAALIRATHTTPAHVLAHSYGAYVALRAAILHPDVVRSLVLVEPPILGWLAETPAGDSVERAFRSAVLTPSRDAFARGDTVDGLRRFLDGVVRPGMFDAMPPNARLGLLRLAGEMRSEMLTPRVRYMTPITCVQVGGLTTPMLIVQGERSARLFHLIEDRLRACAARADTVTIPGAGHGAAAQGSVLHERALAFFAAH